MGVRRGCPKFFLKYPAVGADSHSRAADRYFRPPIVRRCASRRRPLPPWGRRREALPPGPEPLGMNPQLRGHFRGRLAAAEPELHGMLLKGLVKLLSDVLGLVHRCIHSCFVHICLALPVSDFSRRPKSLIFAKILPRISRMTRISLKQKGTKETKEEFFFVAFVCFCANFILWAAWVEDSESVKSVKSVVQFLRLRLAALGSFAEISCPICMFLRDCNPKRPRRTGFSSRPRPALCAIPSRAKD